MVFAACTGGKLDPEKLPPPPGGGGAGGGNVVLPPLNLPLPKTADGKWNLIQVGRSGIDLDPTLKDPLTALGGCTDLITRCYAPGSKSLDDCVSGAVACEASRPPWEALAACCPSDCKNAYATARANGTGDFASFDQVFFQDPSCFPGVKDLIGAAP